jgi:membrane associated rhomboid family serine protease
MFPFSTDVPRFRTPAVTIALLATIGAVWVLIQGAGLDDRVLAATICNYGMVPGELTRSAPVGLAVPLGENLACVVDRDPINFLTPLLSMFLHGGWGHVLGNGLFLWVFGGPIEDTMGRARYLVFYLLSGLVAAAVQVAIDPSSPLPVVGASGAISGVMGAFLLLYPRVRVNVLIPIIIIIRIIPVPAYLMLVWWIGAQILAGLPELSPVRPEVSSGVAVWAHIGGFATGLLLAKLFADPALHARHLALRRSVWR